MRRPAPAADEGFSLIELLVAISIIGVVMTGLAAGLITALDVTADSRDRTIAANLASQEIDLASAVPADRLEAGTVFHVEDVEGTRFDVRRVSAWETGVTEAQACTALANSSVGRGRRFLQVNVTVEWQGRGLRGPVEASTAITPAVASYLNGYGHVAVTIVDRDAAPQAGITVTLTGQGTLPGGGVIAVTRSVTTTSIGCAFFSDVPPGTNYRVAVNQPGYVDQDVTTPGFEEPVVVEDRTTTKRQFTYDMGAGLDLTIAGQAGASVPNGMVVTARSNAATSNDRLSAIGAGTARRTIGAALADGTPTRDLFPHAGGWTTWAGCAANRPEATTWVEPGTRQVNSTQLATAPGQSVAGTVNSGTLQVRAYALQSARGGQPLHAVDTTAVDAPCTTPLFLGNFGPLGSFTGDIALPIGDWRLVYGPGDTPVGNGATIRVGPYRAASYTEPLPSYYDTIRADAPFWYHRLAESLPAAAVDSSGSSRHGTYGAGVTRNVGGATGDGNAAVALNGATSGIVTTPGPALTAQNTLTVEIWFQTTVGYNSGGKIMGYGNNQSTQSTSFDRHLYMLNSGELVFGVYPGGHQTVRSGTTVYNDGNWHHAVGRLSTAGLFLYVDGALVSSNTAVTTAQAFSGHFRVGYDNLGSWPGPSTSAAFQGNVDEFAYYRNKALSAARITAHYNARASGYAQAVLADGPYYYYRFGDEAADSSVNGRTGQYQRGVARGTASALNNDADAAVTLDGTTTGLVANPTPVTNPNVFSLEVWFRTGSTTGGRLLGFGTSLTGTSTLYDRHVYLRDDGRLVFGVYPGEFRTIQSPGAYRDNLWHHVVATLSPSGMALYVDGVLVASDPATTAGEASSGYWRIGRDTLEFWPGAPSSYGPTAAVDEAAVYDRALTAAQVEAHYRASGR